MNQKFLDALVFAIKGHGDQKRKYTGDPYIIHPIEVARALARHQFPTDVQIGGLFHDLVEDTSVTLNQIEWDFGKFVADLVEQVTDVALPGTGPRAHRVQKNIEHAAMTDYYGAAIKLADLISNTRNIVEHDPNFAKVYLAEKARYLEVLKPQAPIQLWQEAQIALDEALQSIAGNHVPTNAG